MPGEVYEGASIDGCGKLRAFATMTLPLLRGAEGNLVE